MPTLADAACVPILNGSFPGSFGILGNSWLGLTLLALATSLLILVLFYIFANFMRNQQMITWSKFELFQIFGTATILIFSIGWVVGMCQFDMSFLGAGHTPNPYIDQTTGRHMTTFEIAEKYFSKMDVVAKKLFFYMMYVSKWIVFLQKVTYFSSPLGLGMTDNPLDSLGQLNSVIFFMVSGFITSYLLLSLQMRMMEYMAAAILFYLFPFGIFFRAFEPTRAFGGALIGISLSFMLFYPVAIVFNDYIMSSSLNSDAVSSELGDALQHADSVVGSGQAPDEEALSEAREGIRTRESVESISKGAGTAIIFLLKPLAFYVIAAVVLPVMNFLVVVEITRGLTKVLGEELDVSNLTRLI